MTRRKSKQEMHRQGISRSERITKLINAGWITTEDKIPIDTILIDPDLINLGGSYLKPTCFQDQPFVCQDCGSDENWKAIDQAWYFETTFAPYYSKAIRCRACREREKERKQLARKEAGH